MRAPQTHSHSQESACSAGGHRYSGQSAAAVPLTRRAAALQTYSSQLVDPLTSATYGAFSTKRPATVSEGSRRSRRSKGSRGSRSSRGLAERHPNRPHSVSGSRSSGDSFFDKPSSRGSDPTGLLDGCVPLAAAAAALCKAEQLRAVAEWCAARGQGGAEQLPALAVAGGEQPHLRPQLHLRR